MRLQHLHVMSSCNQGLIERQLLTEFLCFFNKAQKAHLAQSQKAQQIAYFTSRVKVLAVFMLITDIAQLLLFSLLSIYFCLLKLSVYILASKFTSTFVYFHYASVWVQPRGIQQFVCMCVIHYASVWAEPRGVQQFVCMCVCVIHSFTHSVRRQRSASAEN